MDDMVRRYVILRIRVVTAVVAIGLLVVLLSYLLPMSPLRVFLRLALLLGGLVWIFGYLKAAALSFFLAALMALLLFQVPLQWSLTRAAPSWRAPPVSCRALTAQGRLNLVSRVPRQARASAFRRRAQALLASPHTDGSRPHINVRDDEAHWQA